MTRVTLAVEYQGAAPDSTIDVPRHEALALLAAGRARPAQEPTKSTTTDVATLPAYDVPVA